MWRPGTDNESGSVEQAHVHPVQLCSTNSVIAGQARKSDRRNQTAEKKSGGAWGDFLFGQADKTQTFGRRARISTVRCALFVWHSSLASLTDLQISDL
jgi:hypothetical protein